MGETYGTYNQSYKMALNVCKGKKDQYAPLSVLVLLSETGSLKLYPVSAF